MYPMNGFFGARRRFARVAAVAALVGVWAVAGGATNAADDVFTVSDISVDVTADTAAAARARAFRRGQRAALTSLLRRLTLRDDRSRLPPVDNERLDFMVQALEVADEKTSNVRYLATMTVTFKPPEVRRLLREAGIGFAESTSKPVLVLPVMQAGGVLVLWDDPNEWRDAWSQLSLSGGLVPLIVPVGDLSDIADVDAAQATEGDPLRLSAIASRYGAGDVLVAVATLSDANNAIRVEIAASQIGAPTQRPILLNFRISDPEAIPDLLVGAATGVAAAVEDAWKSTNIIEFDRPGRMLLAVPLNSLEQWVSVERRLNNIAAISNVSLISLTRDSAAIEISHFGDESQLATILAQQDLALGTAFRVCARFGSVPLGAVERGFENARAAADYTVTTAETPAQLVLDLGHRPALGRADFLVSECNSDAVAWIDRWPDWPSPGLVIWGPAASGKSHLGQVWRARAGAPTVTAADLDQREPPDLIGDSGAVYFDGADTVAGNPEHERLALHLYNLIAGQRGHILFSARTPPARWNLGLADLRSRLNALPAARIAPPDDAVLGALLVKLFADRQLPVSGELVQFAVTHMERSFEAAERLVAGVDTAALASQRRVTLNLLRDVLSAMEAAGHPDKLS